MCLTACLACTNGDSDGGPTFLSAKGLIAQTLFENGLILSGWGPTDGQLTYLAGGLQRRDSGLLIQLEPSVRRVPTPSGPTLWWVSGGRDGTHWAVGSGGRILSDVNGTWKAEENPAGERATLWGIWAGDATDVWAVGGSTETTGPKGLVLRRNDEGWRSIEVPRGAAGKNLFKVWGGAHNDVHIVGEGGVALHWNGVDLRAVTTPGEELLFTVHGNGQGLVLAVGGNQSGKVLRWSGSEWVQDGFPEAQPRLNGVFVRHDGVAFACGERASVYRRAPDGVWEKLVVRTEFPSDTFHGLWAEDGIWAFGGDFQRSSRATIASNRALPGALQIPPVESQLDMTETSEMDPLRVTGGREDLPMAGRGADMLAGGHPGIDAGGQVASSDAVRTISMDVSAGTDWAGDDVAGVMPTLQDNASPDGPSNPSSGGTVPMDRLAGAMAQDEEDCDSREGGCEPPSSTSDGTDAPMATEARTLRQGEYCGAERGLECGEGLTCLGVEEDGFREYCMRQCFSPDECAPTDCCTIPGFQEFRLFCVARSFFGDECL